ncbi:MAG: hypothetical protein V5A45_15545 [Haloarculaceae archaeon]
MATSEAECLDALQEAAARLDKSPTKAEYEELELVPSSATIIRAFGSWNEAKNQAELKTAPSTGSRVKSKPDSVDIPDDIEWKNLSVDQRWHYRNVEYNTERSLDRRSRLRSWVNERKAESGCRRCGQTEVACLEYHHTNPELKEKAIGELITHGHGKQSLREEMAKCEILCANCHRKEHYEWPENPGEKREKQRQWLYEYKRETGGCHRCPETDPRCLVFHHSGEKRATAASLVANGATNAAIQAEIQRCTVLCANCHRKEHFESPVRTS